MLPRSRNRGGTWDRGGRTQRGCEEPNTVCRYDNYARIFGVERARGRVGVLKIEQLGRSRGEAETPKAEA